MLVIAAATVFIMVIALGVLYLVAWPNITSGARLLTPEGEELTRAARRRARRAAKAARRAARTATTRAASEQVEQAPAEDRVIDLRAVEKDDVSYRVTRAVRAREAAAQSPEANPGSSTNSSTGASAGSGVPSQKASTVSSSVGVSETIAG